MPKNGHITTNAAVPRWQRDAWRARLARDPSKDQQLRLLLILTNVWHSPCVSPWRVAIAMVPAQIASRPADSHAEFADRRTGSLLEIDAWIRSEVNAISPLAKRLMGLIEGSHCITGEEHAVELALREALSDAVVHGNRLDAHKLVHVRCRCKIGKGISLIVSDQGQGFDVRTVPEFLTVENLEAEHGRGIHPMRLLMDQVSFEQRGTEVHMCKRLARNAGADARSDSRRA